MSLENIIKNVYVERDLSGDEIIQLTGKPCVRYSDIGKYKSVNQLLGAEKAVVIFLETSSYSNGHFVCLSRSDITGMLRYIDSYGMDILEDVQYAPTDKPLPHYLNNLIGKEPYEYNKTQYQAFGNKVSCCGRYASCFFRWRNLSLSQIYTLFKTNKDSFLQKPDNCVVALTLISLNNIRDYLIPK